MDDPCTTVDQPVDKFDELLNHFGIRAREPLAPEIRRAEVQLVEFLEAKQNREGKARLPGPFHHEIDVGIFADCRFEYRV